MKKFSFPLSPAQIAEKIPGELINSKELILDNAAQLSESNPNSICFYENKKYLNDLKTAKAGMIFVKPDFSLEDAPDAVYFKTEHPYLYFMATIKFWLQTENKSKPFISENAVIAKSATIEENVTIEANAVIGENVKIGKNTTVKANCVIEANSNIGENCLFYPNVSIYAESEIGNNVILHSGVVIGADGFGYILHEGVQQKIPQIGNVILEDDVEIGANSCVDRGTLGPTVIKKGSKIDNLVQVGHNCSLGKNSILCAQVGLAGSTTSGEYVYLGGQVGSAGHLHIGDRAQIAAQSGLAGNVKEDAKLFGTPAVNAMQQKRMVSSLMKLPEFMKTVKKFIKDSK
ncbi:MAG: UDP-3-O-(3-hydroxymyristoyl)glucosamine N-acyltransferase [Candidatus Cloacimonadota bacterium]|nr:MAG: UDP-3-O-(3-hydroxymyristoyl)glucosamine N-acyltransferase [Candidatus Cloacimonadota bacterium]